MKHADFQPVVEIVKGVGDQIAAWRDDDSARRMLDPKAFKVNADLRAHGLLSEAILKLFPEAAVLSEEDAEHERRRPSAYWLLDPIDGTASWYEGFAGFASQAAYIVDAQPMFGIVYAPALGKLWTGVAGDGARLNGEALPMLRPGDRRVVVDNYPDPRRAAKLLVERLPATGYRESGSLGIKCCLVADGSADLFVKDVVTRDWDIAPAAPIIAGVGGVLSLPDGAPYVFDGDFNKPSGVLVARDAALARRASDLLVGLRS